MGEIDEKGKRENFKELAYMTGGLVSLPPTEQASKLKTQAKLHLAVFSLNSFFF